MGINSTMIIEYTNIGGRKHQKIEVQIHDNLGAQNFIKFLKDQKTEPVINKDSNVYHTISFGDKPKAISTLKLNECIKLAEGNDIDNVDFNLTSGIFALTCDNHSIIEYNLGNTITPNNKVLPKLFIVLNFGDKKYKVVEYLKSISEKALSEHPNLKLTNYKIADIDRDIAWKIDRITNIIL